VVQPTAPLAYFSQNRMRGKTAIIARELDELGRVLICGRPTKCKRFLKRVGT